VVVFVEDPERLQRKAAFRAIRIQS
jgi:hypothetical protein